MTPSVYRLRLPGPTAIPERVRQAIARPVLSHRGPEFLAILDRAEKLLQPILGTRNPVLFFACSGTGVMEASLVNVLEQGERVLVCVTGQFGERFADIAKALGANVDTLEVAWGQSLDPAEIETRLSAAHYRAVVVIHNESSTGVVADLPAIGNMLRNRPALLVVDSVSGLGGIEMRQDEWGIDIVASSSQKALMCPPGIGILSVSPKAWEVVRRETAMPRFYWDIRKAMRDGAALETPFTPAVSLLFGLQEALEMIHAEGLPQVLKRHSLLSTALRRGANAMGLATFPKTEAFSSTVVALETPGNLSASDIIRVMYDRHGTVIAGSRNKLGGSVIRIGTMGDLHEGDILTDLLHLEATLTELGWPVTPGSGIEAALEVLSAR